MAERPDCIPKSIGRPVRAGDDTLRAVIATTTASQTTDMLSGLEPILTNAGQLTRTHQEASKAYVQAIAQQSAVQEDVGQYYQASILRYTLMHETKCQRAK